MAVRSQTLEAYRLECIAQGEHEHASQLQEFSHRVRLSFNSDLNANCDRMVAIEEFLLTVLSPEDFRAFPGTAVGKYKEDIFCVFFRHSKDAILMKLTL